MYALYIMKVSKEQITSAKLVKRAVIPLVLVGIVLGGYQYLHTSTHVKNDALALQTASSTDTQSIQLPPSSDQSPTQIPQATPTNTSTTNTTTTDAASSPPPSPQPTPSPQCTADDQDTLNVFRKEYQDFKAYLIAQNLPLTTRTNGGVTLDMMQININTELSRGCV